MITRSSFSSNLLKKLSSVDASFLEFSFSIEEVKKEIWCSGVPKPRDPDVLFLNFSKKN